MVTSGGKEPQSSSDVTMCENTTEDCDLLSEDVCMGRMRWGGVSEGRSEAGLDALWHLRLVQLGHW